MSEIEKKKMRVCLLSSGEIVVLSGFTFDQKVAIRLLVRGFPNAYVHVEGSERVRAGNIDLSSIDDLNPSAEDNGVEWRSNGCG